MRPWLHRLMVGLFRLYERIYRRLHGLQAVDDLLFIKRSAYRGAPRQFADGTRLEPGDGIGVIHFNNDYLGRIQTLSHHRGSSKKAAFIFGAALIKSMHELAALLSRSPNLQELRVIGGITWFKAHGREIGFEIEPLPPGARQRLLRAHFRLLLILLFPHLAARENHRLEPHQFWITRRQLQALAESDTVYTARRLAMYEQQLD